MGICIFIGFIFYVIAVMVSILGARAVTFFKTPQTKIIEQVGFIFTIGSLVALLMVIGTGFVIFDVLKILGVKIVIQ